MPDTVMSDNFPVTAVYQYSFNLMKTDIIATEAHGITRKKVFQGIYSSVFFRVLPWLLCFYGY